MLWRVMVVLGLLAGAAQAQVSPLLADYWVNSGSLPPEYAWEVNITIREDGHLALRHCKGYATEGPGCTLRQAQVAADKLAAIRAAADAADLVARPPQRAPDDQIPVGGGARGGGVFYGGDKVVLPAWPAAADADRVGSVLSAIAAAIPPRLHKRFIAGN